MSYFSSNTLLKSARPRQRVMATTGADAIITVFMLHTVYT